MSERQRPWRREISVNLSSDFVSPDFIARVDAVPAPQRPVSGSPARPPAALLTSTSWWPFTARIAMRLAELGWRVEAICPAGHPLRKTRAVARAHRYAALRPLAALSAAIATAAPDLIVPCDDRAFAHLVDLHARLGAAVGDAGAAMARLIAQSLGPPQSWTAAVRRDELIRIAREEGVRAPETRPLDGAGDLHAAIAAFGLPVVLKVDGSWGGFGVAIAHTPVDAERAYAMLTRRLDMERAFKRLLFDRDPFHLLPWLARKVPRATVQRFVRGRPANSIAACWDGEVLASIEVEVLRTHTSLGASNVVRRIAHPDMTQAAERLARRLGLCGFWGLDFMIEDDTGHAHLIEMNSRATPLCHLALGPGRDPVAALAARLEGAPPPPTVSITDNPTIAFFPQAWHLAPDSAFLSTGYHDVPWQDPELLRELIRLPYPDRGLLARLLARLRH